ncbi:MAG: KpsF/GutQ family sugar-phosphate isomerase [Kiritimatiellae bacterium]|nr:KpsF/GutQ family sugar-phosphate isomerase [Kiritimatiellia bacterium]
MKKAKRDVRHGTRGKASLVSRISSRALLSRAREVFDVEIEGLKRTRASIGPSFAAAVRLLYDTTAAGGIVVVTGVGKNLHAAEKISAIFASTGTRSIVLNPVQAMHGDLGMVSQGDVLLALSFSGESEEVLRLIPAVRRHGLKVVSMTGSDASTLAVQSDVHLAIPCGKEACPFGMAPTSSVTATLAMGDALAMVLIDMHKFSIRDYAENHPAGAIGRALLLTVADVMRTGDRLAVVSPSATVMDTLMAMTKAQSGSAVIVDRRGKLLGIFTDGDFRRLMASGALSEHSATDIRQPGGGCRPANVDTLSSPISRYMTRSPVFALADSPASELLKVFESRRIDDLPVCDAKGRFVGLVEIHDLPKMKVI